VKLDNKIILSDSQVATIIKGEESGYKNSYIVTLANGELRVVDKDTLTLAETLGKTKTTKYPPRKNY